jgi:hypothetical protein
VSHNENILFKDEDSSHNEPLLVEEVGPDLFQLLECPVFTDAVRDGDVIQAERQADNSLLFRSVAQASTYRTWTWVLAGDLVNSPEIVEFCETVRSHGGHCQRDFGGFLQLVLPLGADLDPDAWYEERIVPRVKPRPSVKPVDKQC